MRKLDSDGAATVLRALANETRLKLVGLLALEAQSQTALAERLKTQPEKLSRHLDLLAQAGIVAESSAEHPRTWRLNTGWLQPDRLVVTVLKRPVAVDEAVADMDAHDTKTLAAFVREGHIVRIPAVTSKQIVVMRWLVEKFARDATYPERDVNETLSLVHPDFAALRRMLVDHRFMARQNGIYRRIK